MSTNISSETTQDEQSLGIDPVTCSVIHGALENITIEMGLKLMRMAHSSIIRESEDFGAAIIDAAGNGLAESSQSTPLQSGPLPGYILGMQRILADRSESLYPGDVIMHNDPYSGASHVPDVAFIVPIFWKDELVGYSATTAHHLDIGSLSPGSCGIVDALDAYAEGLQFKAIKVFEGGRRNDMIWHVLRDNIRASELVVGDMEAQIAASRIGAARVLDLIAQHGLNTFQMACIVMMDQAERLMRNAITKLPDGIYRASTAIDGYLDDPERRELPLVVTLTVEGDNLHVDLEGSAPQVSDRPINMPFKGTVDVAIWLTIRSILLDATVYGHIPVNIGLIRPISISAPLGCIVNPIFPAPTIARFAPGNQLADTVMKALAQALPKQVSAGIGNLKVVAFSGLTQSTHWVHMEIFEGSYGGRHNMDGMDAVDTLYANTRNNPIEDIESHVPLRVRRYELREQAIGAGKFRGGLGAVREFEFLSDGGVSVEGEGHRYRPWGFDGGDDGWPAEMSVTYQGSESIPLTSKLPYMPVKAGTRFTMVGPAGGGYGDPHLRDPKRVLNDVLDGLISRECAANDFAVVVTNTFAIDEKATAALRASLPVDSIQ